MKILVVGDAHFRLDLPYGTYFEDGRRGEWGEVKKAIIDASQECDAVVLLGDVLDKRHNHSSVLAELVDFLKALGDKDVHIISGNHEKYEGEKTALDFLKDVNPRWRVYTKPSFGKIGETTVTFVPYMTNAELTATTKDEARNSLMWGLSNHETDLMFHHHAMSGHQTLGGLTDLFNEIVFDKDLLSRNYKMVIGGHIHEPQGDENVMVAGSIFSSSAGEMEKRVLVLDTDTMGVESLPLPTRPIHSIAFTRGMELGKIPNRAIVRATIYDPEIGVGYAHEMLSRFDAYALVENYPNERVKAHIENANDLSIEGLLRTYAKARDVDESELMSAFDLIKE